MKRIFGLVLTLLSLARSTARGEDLAIGRVQLRLGMPQERVLQELSKEFEARQVSVTEGKYLLRPRRGPHAEAGSVSFRNGKLYRAAKTWGETPAPPGASQAMEGLVAVLAHLSEKGWRNGRVRVETLTASGASQIPGSRVKLVTLELSPDRTIVVQVNEPLNAVAGSNSLERLTTVQEFLVERPRQ